MRPTEGFDLGKKAPWVKIFNTLTQLDEHDSLSSFSTQNIFNDFLSCMTIHVLYLPQKTLRYCLIFYDVSLYFCVMSYLNIMLCNVMECVVVNTTPNDFKNPPEYIPDEFSSW